MSRASEPPVPLTCPSCGEVDSHRDRFTAIEVRGVYDGVLIWKCSACGVMWSRFSRAEWARMHDRALKVIAEQEVGLR